MRVAIVLATAVTLAAGCSLFDGSGGGSKNPRPLQIEFFAAPHGDTVANRTIEDVVVRLLDADGELVEDLNVEFSLEINPGTNGSDWVGPNYVFSTNGTATFSGIRILYPGAFAIHAFALIDGTETYDGGADDPLIVHSLFLDPPVIHPAGRVPTATRLADLDGDGDLDIATSNQYSHDITLLVNDGTGAFTAPTPIPVPTQPTHLAIAHLTTGSQPDIVLRASGSFWALANTSTGAGPVFASPSPLGGSESDLQPISLASTAGAIAYSSGTSAQIYGAGPSSVTIPIDSDHISSGDFDGDGRGDLLVSSVVNTIDRAVWILLAQTAGGYAAATPVDDALDFHAANAGNFDGLGGDDAVVLDLEPPTGITVLLNSSGSLIRGEKLIVPVDEVFTRFGVADIDGDGFDDVYVVNNGALTFRSRGDGTLELFQVFPVPSGGIVTFGDLDGDGDLEAIVTTDDDPGEHQVFENALVP